MNFDEVAAKITLLSTFAWKSGASRRIGLAAKG
jgi:hypothetical protein